MSSYPSIKIIADDITPIAVDYNYLTLRGIHDIKGDPFYIDYKNNKTSSG